MIDCCTLKRVEDAMPKVRYILKEEWPTFFLKSKRRVFVPGEFGEVVG